MITNHIDIIYMFSLHFGFSITHISLHYYTLILILIYHLSRFISHLLHWLHSYTLMRMRADNIYLISRFLSFSSLHEYHYAYFITWVIISRLSLICHLIISLLAICRHLSFTSLIDFSMVTSRHFTFIIRYAIYWYLMPRLIITYLPFHVFNYFITLCGNKAIWLFSIDAVLFIRD